MDKPPSLKQILNDTAKQIATAREDKELRRVVRNVIGMCLSLKFKSACLLPNYLSHFDIDKARIMYGMHMAVYLKDFGEKFNQPLKGPFTSAFLGLTMEYLNLLIALTKKEKEDVHKRMHEIRCSIMNLKVEHDLWDAKSALLIVHRTAVRILTEAVMECLL